MTNPLSYAERRRIHNKRRAKKLQTRYSNRTDEELARDQAELFPAGRAVCRHCGRSLPLTAFPQLRRRRDGILPYCTDCTVTE